MKKKEKIPTSGDSTPLSSPFTSFHLEGLPDLKPSLVSNQSIPATPAKKGRVVLRKETSQRAGKAVIVVSQFESRINLREIDELARGLKKFCGCGGTVKDREIEIQGDQPAKIRSFLENQGFRVDGVR
ncbi:MAG: translation initiation factor [Verrucomicrobiia bacterium]